MSRTAGLVLAAGAGTRFGGPKALARTSDGDPWVRRAVAALQQAGCAPVLVVLGAAAQEASGLVPRTARVVLAEAWAQGLSASLKAGLRALADSDEDTDAVLITLVDLPDLPVAACLRLLDGGADAGSLRQAVYDGTPGHPALLGRHHWARVQNGLHGDRGAGAYLAAAGARRVECGDLFTGADVDRPSSTPDAGP
ncbi:NTP transferase domain-containing protein [uncultured Amnibacterium sp.]|uniref:nucleotidyltransferase family protein n=1 Tax=uncultured Amnibacterium sp. TaxID=1631851 RepID=UPI0035CC0305